VGFDEAAGGAVLLSNYTAVLEGLLRLRQVCCCPTMVPPERIAAAHRMLEVLGQHRKDTQGAADITQAQAQSLFAKLKQVCVFFVNTRLVSRGVTSPQSSFLPGRRRAHVVRRES
jgi:hypothetical protein